jgi:Tfp pilus assembly protein PilX
MILALAVLAVTLLLTAAVFTAVQGDASLTRNDLDGKRAYSAAQAGVQAYLYNLNANSLNSAWWETCSNDMSNGTGTQVTLPGTTPATSYAFSPVPTAAYSACSTTNAVASLIDSSTGTLRIKFTGYAGHAQKTIVTSFKTASPLSFLWYTVHETVDTIIGGSTCSRFYYNNPGPPSACQIVWVTGDHMNGPLYTQDQLLINPGGAPVFGRTSKDQIISQAPTTTVCAAVNGCQGAVFKGQATANPVNQVQLPTDNSNLLADATSHGKVFTGATTLTVNAATNLATGWNCPTATTCTAVSVDTSQYPIIYAVNGSGCNTTYDPTNVTYATTSGSPTGRYYGPCGDVYISGTYDMPLTIAAANDIILTGNLTTTEDSSGNPSGAATLGLVANYYVRVKHDCTGNPAVTIDGAILTLYHSFFVDNYDCGGTPLGTLTVHGAIAQFYRGIVGQVGTSGYLKNYNYDDRLGLILPPYLFDLTNTQWGVYRETLCSPTAASTNTGSCLYQGS